MQYVCRVEDPWNYKINANIPAFSHTQAHGCMLELETNDAMAFYLWCMQRDDVVLRVIITCISNWLAAHMQCGEYVLYMPWRSNIKREAVPLCTNKKRICTWVLQWLMCGRDLCATFIGCKHHHACEERVFVYLTHERTCRVDFYFFNCCIFFVVVVAIVIIIFIFLRQLKSIGRMNYSATMCIRVYTSLFS